MTIDYVLIYFEIVINPDMDEGQVEDNILGTAHQSQFSDNCLAFYRRETRFDAKVFIVISFFN